MKERVLITGASGFVGYHLIVEAINAGMDVFAAVRPGSDTEHLKGLPIQFVTLAYHDRSELVADFNTNNYDYIIHAAGRTKAKTQEQYNRANAGLTRDLALATIEYGKIKKFIFISSLAAIGPNTDNGGPITVSKIPSPVTAYGKSKLLAEKYLSEIPGLPLVVLRPTAVYGPRERDLFVVLKTLAAGLEPYIGSNEQKLSFVYVKDLAAITVASLTGNAVAGSAFNIADGKVYSRHDFAAIAKIFLRKRTLSLTIPTPLIRILASVMDKLYSFSSSTPLLNEDKINELTANNWSCSIQEAVSWLNYHPNYDLRRGLEETIDWYKKNSWLN